MEHYDNDDRRSRRRRSQSPGSDYDRRTRDRNTSRDRRRPRNRDRSPRDLDRSHRDSRRPRHRSKSAEGYDRKRYRRRSASPRRHHRDDRDRERRSRRHRSKSSSSSPRRIKQSRSPSPHSKRSRAPLPSQQEAFGTEDKSLSKTEPPPEKQKPNFGNTGRLAAESNKVEVEGGNSIVLKYHEPGEARKPPAKDDWRLYIFKGSELLETINLGVRSCWLFGRERLVVDFPVDHPSCSKQHAVIQFRYVEKKNEFGDRTGKVRPYLIDLESANGTKVNGEEAPKGRYMELMDKDVLQFGLSTREYVLMLAPPG